MTSHRLCKSKNATKCLIFRFFKTSSPLLYYLLYNYQRTLEETGKRGQETYYLKSCLQLSCCLAFHRLFECTGIKVCLITSILVKPSSSRTLLVQSPQLTFVSRNRIPDISLQKGDNFNVNQLKDTAQN